jgi:hypothetical protein
VLESGGFRRTPGNPKKWFRGFLLCGLMACIRQFSSRVFSQNWPLNP